MTVEPCMWTKIDFILGMFNCDNFKLCLLINHGHFNMHTPTVKRVLQFQESATITIYYHTNNHEFLYRNFILLAVANKIKMRDKDNNDYLKENTQFCLRKSSQIHV